MDTKPTFGAAKTPHRGQPRDSPAQETADQDAEDRIPDSGREMKTGEDFKWTFGDVGSFIELEL